MKSVIAVVQEARDAAYAQLEYLRRMRAQAGNACIWAERGSMTMCKHPSAAKGTATYAPCLLAHPRIDPRAPAGCLLREPPTL